MTNDNQTEFDLATVRHLAQLACLTLTPQEEEQYQVELKAILGYIDQLLAVDLTTYSACYQVSGLTDVTRSDQPWSIDDDLYPSADDLLAGLQPQSNRQFKLPRFLAN